MLGITVQGLLLFLFVPLVLFLFLRQPLGPGWSVALGLAIMAGHRLVAAPWMAKFADVRCLWCGRVGVSATCPVVAGGRTWMMSACSARHAQEIARVLRFAHRFRVPIRAGIFLPLAWLLLASLADAAGRPLLSHDANALIFRVVVATTVLAASTLPFASRGLALPPLGDPASLHGAPERCPVPLHNLFLLGIRTTLWVFRLVGTWWLADSLLRLAH